MSKLLVTLLVSLALFSSPMMVKAAEIEGGEVLKFGIFKTEAIRTEAASGAAAGAKVVIKNQKLVEPTTRIPARKGLEFGFEYVIKGQPAGDTVEVTNKYLHPPVTNPQTKKSFSSQTTSTKQKIGKTAYVGYDFEHDWEAVPGEWTIQVFCQGKKVAEKSFQVIKH
jgi:hypothetical protein